MSSSPDSHTSPVFTNIYQKIINTFREPDQVETLLRILWYLDSENSLMKLRSPENTSANNAHQNLISALHVSNDQEFKKLASNIAAQTKVNESDMEFRAKLNLVYNEITTEKVNSPSSVGKKYDQFDFEGFDVIGSSEFDLSEITCFQPLADSWSQMPLSCQSAILEIIPKLISDPDSETASGLAVTAEEFKKKISGLAETALNSDTLRDLKSWWNDEISNRSSPLSHRTSRAAGLAASMAGSTLGGGIGGSFGRAAGTIIGVLAGHYIIYKINEEFLKKPKHEALDDAYKFFGVTKDATDAEINSAFRKQCLKHHPDKGGKAEDFIKVQLHMEVIKCARESK